MARRRIATTPEQAADVQDTHAVEESTKDSGELVLPVGLMRYILKFHKFFARQLSNDHYNQIMFYPQGEGDEQCVNVYYIGGHWAARWKISTKLGGVQSFPSERLVIVGLQVEYLVDALKKIPDQFPCKVGNGKLVFDGGQMDLDEVDPCVSEGQLNQVDTYFDQPKGKDQEPEISFSASYIQDIAQALSLNRTKKDKHRVLTFQFDGGNPTIVTPGDWMENDWGQLRIVLMPCI